MIARIRAFGAFWYDFVVGDDWRVAAGVVFALAVSVTVSHTSDIPAWWIGAAAVAFLLPLSVYRVARRQRAAPVSPPKT